MLPALSDVQPSASIRSTGRLSRSRWIHLRDLLWTLIARDIKLRYRGSLLGMAWTLLNPIAELLVLLFVFKVVMPLGIPNYGAFLFTALLVYGWFQTALTFATVSVVNSRELIRRPDVPTAVLPIVSVASTLIHFVLSLPVLFALLVITDVPITRAILLLPALIALEFVLIAALAYPLAALHVWFRDTQYMLRVVLQLLFYLTPIFYDARSIPERYQFIYSINPMVFVVDAFRDVVVRGRLPDPVGLLGVAVVASVMLAVSLAIFKRASHRFGDEL
jgi:lipopolysaccharide transport system permease protein